MLSGGKPTFSKIRPNALNNVDFGMVDPSCLQKTKFRSCLYNTLKRSLLSFSRTLCVFNSFDSRLVIGISHTCV
jgi:hypothetical protein